MPVITRDNQLLEKTLITPEQYGHIITANQTYYASGYADFADLLTAVGDKVSTIVVDAPIVVTADTTITDTCPNTTITTQNPGKFTISSGVTLTIDVPFTAGLYQVFDGGGSVTGLTEVQTAWFGNDITLASNSTTGIVYCNDVVLDAEATVSNACTLTGNIRQTALDTTAIIVTAADVKFENINITGNSSESVGADIFTGSYGIFFNGTSTNNLSNNSVLNSTVSGFDACIRATWNTDFKVDNCYLYDCMVGVFGSISNGEGSLDQNNTNELNYAVTNSKIICSFGSLAYSRPVVMPYLSGGLRVESCYLRGGGMAIETVLHSATLTATPRHFILFNDSDTAFSVGSSSKIHGNMMDLNNAPAGRGAQASYYEAIECGVWSTISENTVSNFVNGVGVLQIGMTIINNKFLNCATSEAGNGGIIYLSADTLTSDTRLDVLISGNVFENTGSTANDIYLQVGASHGYVAQGITISNNISTNCAYSFMKLTNVVDSIVANNNILNCCRLMTSNPIGVWESSCAITYENNVFKNTLLTNGMQWAIAQSVSSVFGYNEFNGMRSSAFYSVPKLYSSPVYKWNGSILSYMRTVAGSPSGSLTPTWIGEIVRDISGSNFYIGYDTSSSIAWKIMT